MRHLVSNSHPSDGREEIPAEHQHLDLLGTIRLRPSDQPVAGFEHAHLQHLLAYIVLNRTATISRQQHAFLFWPDVTNQQPLKNLHTLLTRLRHALPAADHFIGVTAQTILWHPYIPFSLDVVEFEKSVAQVAAAVEM